MERSREESLRRVLFAKRVAIMIVSLVSYARVNWPMFVVLLCGEEYCLEEKLDWAF